MSLSIATLICVYAGDSPQMFREALDSVVGQRLRPDIESRIYLGIDGPVPAELRQVVDDYADHIHRIQQSHTNKGLAHTLNGLLCLLQEEEFVFRMDADDISLPTRYQTQIDYLTTHPDIDILGTAITELDASSGEEREIRFCTSPADAVANIHRRVPVAHPTVCFRRRVLHEVKQYPVVGTNEDIALWFECVRRGFVFDNLPASLLRFRISPGFWRRRSLKKARSELLCYVRGIYSLHGLLTPRYFYPLLRFCIRMAPTFVVKWAYKSNFRKVGR